MVHNIFPFKDKCDFQRKNNIMEKKMVEDMVCPLGKLYPVSVTKGFMMGRGLFIITLIKLFKAASPSIINVKNILSNLLSKTK